jgi:hypothetical protein
VHLIGFIIRIYHDAWFSEIQSCVLTVTFETESARLSSVIIIVFMILFVHINCIFRAGKFPRDTAATSPTVRMCGKSTHSKVGVHYICLLSIYLPDFLLEFELTRQTMCV